MYIFKARGESLGCMLHLVAPGESVDIAGPFELKDGSILRVRAIRGLGAIRGRGRTLRSAEFVTTIERPLKAEKS